MYFLVWLGDTYGGVAHRAGVQFATFKTGKDFAMVQQKRAEVYLAVTAGDELLDQQGQALAELILYVRELVRLRCNECLEGRQWLYGFADHGEV
ncbi:protein of unknown function [Thauera humireducens]|nr:protein of unknown function [Thauera humireducens]